MTMTYAQPMPTRYTRARLSVPALWRQVVRSSETAKEKIVPEPDRSAYTQLEIYDGVLAAFERRDEVAAVLGARGTGRPPYAGCARSWGFPSCRRPRCSTCRSPPSAGTGSPTAPRSCVQRSVGNTGMCDHPGAGSTVT